MSLALGRSHRKKASLISVVAALMISALFTTCVSPAFADDVVVAPDVTVQALTEVPLRPGEGVVPPPVDGLHPLAGLTGFVTGTGNGAGHLENLTNAGLVPNTFYIYRDEVLIDSVDVLPGTTIAQYPLPTNDTQSAYTVEVWAYHLPDGTGIQVTSGTIDPAVVELEPIILPDIIREVVPPSDPEFILAGNGQCGSVVLPEESEGIFYHVSPAEVCEGITTVTPFAQRPLGVGGIDSEGRPTVQFVIYVLAPGVIPWEEDLGLRNPVVEEPTGPIELAPIEKTVAPTVNPEFILAGNGQCGSVVLPTADEGIAYLVSPAEVCEGETTVTPVAAPPVIIEGVDPISGRPTTQEVTYVLAAGVQPWSEDLGLRNPVVEEPPTPIELPPTERPVTPEKPNFTDAGNGQCGTIDLPETEHVVYTVSPADACEGPVKVTATPGPTFTEAGFNADGVPTTQLVTPVLADGVTTEWKEDLGLRNPVIPPPHGEPNPINGEFSDTPKYEVVKKVCIGHQGKWIKVATASVKSDGHYLHHNGADIIPPFTMETLGADRTLGLYWNFEGQQWNSENQALHAEGCKDKGEEPKPDPTDPTDPVDPQPNPDPEGPKNPQPEGPKNPEGPTPNNPENPGKDDKDPVKDGGKGDGEGDFFGESEAHGATLRLGGGQGFSARTYNRRFKEALMA